MAFFTMAGRLRRRDYFLRVLGLYALGIIVYAIPGVLYKAEIPAALKVAAFLGLTGIFYLVVVQVLLRLHDLNLRAWWFLVLFLPVVSYVLSAGVQFVQGTIGPNRFGPDPKRLHLLPPTSLQMVDEEAV
jgi:uncharacterized membrane protein YhaH (DUF805 family)